MIFLFRKIFAVIVISKNHNVTTMALAMMDCVRVVVTISQSSDCSCGHGVTCDDIGQVCLSSADAFDVVMSSTMDCNYILPPEEVDEVFETMDTSPCSCTEIHGDHCTMSADSRMVTDTATVVKLVPVGVGLMLNLLIVAWDSNANASTDANQPCVQWRRGFGCDWR